MRGAERISRWLRRLHPSAIVLCYHRVAKLDTDPQLLSVTPKNFGDQLQVLKQLYPVARLRNWRSDQRKLPRRRVIITFDDGYADNFYQALPLLQEADCPATIFITAGKINDNKEFWWDDLERLILAPTQVPEALCLKINGVFRSWNLGSSSANGQTRDEWNVLLEQAKTPRQTAYVDLCLLLRSVDEIERERILNELCSWANLKSAGRSSHRPLTTSELCALASNDLIDIGAHTVSHPSLAALAAPAQQLEIKRSKVILEAIISRPVHTFSYPFGGHDDYNVKTINLVRNAGFDVACANYPGSADYMKDRYQLPRFVVRNWDGDQFAKTIRSWVAS